MYYKIKNQIELEIEIKLKSSIPFYVFLDKLKIIYYNFFAASWILNEYKIRKSVLCCGGEVNLNKNNMFNLINEDLEGVIGEGTAAIYDDASEEFVGSIDGYGWFKN